jgi:hypothetical protein
VRAILASRDEAAAAVLAYEQPGQQIAAHAVSAALVPGSATNLLAAAWARR